MWRSGFLTRQVVLPAVADHAWQLPGLAGRWIARYNRRVELFASYDVQPGDVVMLGDSITEGADWPALFPGVRIHNQGIGGDDTDGVLRRLALVTDRRPGKVFVMIGTNDIGKGVHSVDEIVRQHRDDRRSDPSRQSDDRDLSPECAAEAASPCRPGEQCEPRHRGARAGSRGNVDRPAADLRSGRRRHEPRSRPGRAPSERRGKPALGRVPRSARKLTSTSIHG